MTPGPQAKSGNECGFVLLPVLLVTGLAAIIALTLTLMSRDDIAEMKLARDLALARLNADNALVRAIAALGNPADPLHPLLLRVDEITSIESSGVKIDVAVEHEHGKVDLNVANPALLRLMLQATIPDAADHIAERIDRTRAKGQWIESLDVLFDPATPFLPVADMLQRRFTVLTGAEGLVPELVQRETWQALAMGASMPSDDQSDRSGRWRQERAEALGAIAPFASSSRPIYTIRARVNSEALPPLTRRVVLAYRQLPLVRADDLAIISWD
jgi:hypothetical protein